MLIERKKERKRVLQTKVKSLCCNGRILKKRLNGWRTMHPTCMQLASQANALQI